MIDFEGGLLPSLLHAFPPSSKRNGSIFHNCNAVLKLIRRNFLVSSSSNKNFKKKLCSNNKIVTNLDLSSRPYPTYILHFFVGYGRSDKS